MCGGGFNSTTRPAQTNAQRNTAVENHIVKSAPEPKDDLKEFLKPVKMP